MLPTQIRRLRNTLQPCRTPDAGPTLQPELPPCPAHFVGLKWEVWHELGRRLVEMRVLTTVDAMALEMEAEDVARGGPAWTEARLEEAAAASLAAHMADIAAELE